jgi:prephenate dehydrogenase
MKLQIIGDGAFGSFLKELLAPHFEIVDSADSVVLAVPLSAYDEVAALNKDKCLINVCSVQKPTTDICLKHSNRVISIHPLFGRRTPADKRNSILTYYPLDNDTWSSFNVMCEEFLNTFAKVSAIHQGFTPESHDIMMAKTHLAAAIGARQLKILIDRAGYIPDGLVPHSFRLMREFVKTLEDMPEGTMSSILGNPYG